jgi:hypothetical protein
LLLGGDDARNERDQDQRGGADAHAMSHRELPRTVRPAIGTGVDRPAAEVIREVLPEQVHRLVPSRRILVEGLDQNRVEIAAQTAFSSRPARTRQPGPAAGCRLARLGERHAWSQRRFIANRALDVGGGLRCEAMRPDARQQLIEDRAQRIYVRRRRDRLTADLFRTRIVGGEWSEAWPRDGG